NFNAFASLKQLAGVLDFLADVFLNGAFVFVFDGDESGVAGSSQLTHDLRDARDALAEQDIDFAAGSLHIFQVHHSEMRGQFADRVHGIVAAGRDMSYVEGGSHRLGAARQGLENVLGTFVGKPLLEVMIVNAEGQTFAGETLVDAV